MAKLEAVDNKSLSFRAVEVGEVLCKALNDDRKLSQKNADREKDLLDQATNDLAGSIRSQAKWPLVCSTITLVAKLISTAPMADGFDEMLFKIVGDRVSPDFKDTATYLNEGIKAKLNARVEKLRAEKEEQTQTVSKASNAFTKTIDDLSTLLRYLGNARTS